MSVRDDIAQQVNDFSGNLTKNRLSMFRQLGSTLDELIAGQLSVDWYRYLIYWGLTGMASLAVKGSK